MKTFSYIFFIAILLVGIWMIRQKPAPSGNKSKVVVELPEVVKDWKVLYDPLKVNVVDLHSVEYQIHPESNQAALAKIQATALASMENVKENKSPGHVVFFKKGRLVFPLIISGKTVKGGGEKTVIISDARFVPLETGEKNER